MKEYYRAQTDYQTMQTLAEIMERRGGTEVTEAATAFQQVYDTMVPLLPEHPSTEQTGWVNRTLWHFFDRLETAYVSQGVSHAYATQIVALNTPAVERVFQKVSGLLSLTQELHGV